MKSEMFNYDVSIAVHNLLKLVGAKSYMRIDLCSTSQLGSVQVVVLVTAFIGSLQNTPHVNSVQKSNNTVYYSTGMTNHYWNT